MTRIVGSSLLALILGTSGAGSFLVGSARIPGWIAPRFVSGVYSSLLFIIAASLTVLLHRALIARRAEPPQHSSSLRLSPRSVVEILGAVAVALAGVHMLDYLLKRAVDFSYRRVAPLFDLGREQNLPTLFSTALLLLCVALLWAIAAIAKRRGQGYLAWAGLTGLFAFLALDEFAEVHEHVFPTVQRAADPHLLSGREWVVVYGLLLIPLGLAYLPFLLGLRPATRRRFVLAGVVYVCGALGLELLCGWHLTRAPLLGPVHTLLIVGEELLEIAGVLIFIHALIDHLEQELGAPLVRHDLGDS